MKLTCGELEYLSAWAREEREPACYGLPAHQLQLAHGVSGASMILFIKARTIAKGKNDLEILTLHGNSNPDWPWSTIEEFYARLENARMPGTIQNPRQRNAGRRSWILTGGPGFPP